jgi:hypothetical protein
VVLTAIRLGGITVAAEICCHHGKASLDEARRDFAPRQVRLVLSVLAPVRRTS